MIMRTEPSLLFRTISGRVPLSLPVRLKYRQREQRIGCLMGGLLWRGMESAQRRSYAGSIPATGLWNTRQPSRSYGSKMAEISSEAHNRLRATMRTLFQCLDGKSLWDEVSAAGVFTLHLVSAEKAPSGGHCLPMTRKIFISRSEQEMGPVLLLGLHALQQAQQNAELSRNICLIGPERYVTGMQLVEWQATIKTQRMICDNIKEGYWPSSWRQGSQQGGYNPRELQQPQTFQEFQTSQQRTADRHRAYWNETCRQTSLATRRQTCGDSPGKRE